MTEHFDCIIVGSGPAGVSASLYTLRAGFSTALFSTEDSGLHKAEKIENYYGFPEGVSGEDLLARGHAQAARLGGRILHEEVVRVEALDGITVHTAGGRCTAGALLLATGAKRQTVKIPGLAELEGRGVSACAVCDGFFHRGKPVAVLGSGEYAAAEAKELLPLAASVTVLTNGEQPTADFGTMPVITTPVIEVLGGERLQGVRLSDGRELALSGLFLALGKASAVSLAMAAGILVEEKGIVVDERGRTNLPGVYAAGDCIGGLLQIATAVGEGAVAGAEICGYLRETAGKGRP